MIRQVITFLLLLLLSVPALAADATGQWSLRASDVALMTFTIGRTPTGWTAEWRRPENFSWDGEEFAQVKGPVIMRVAKQVRELPDGIEMTFDDPRPGATSDIFMIHTRNGNSAELTNVSIRSEPVPLVRATGIVPLGGWDASRRYVLSPDRSTDPEMTAIFNADQRDREHWETADRKIVSAADQVRRIRTQQLVDSGKLSSGDDFYHAAFVFQHGSLPADYLKAHALAVISAARGKHAATWIAAATLDRYLQTIGQPQIYGTQFSTHGGAWTQAPYQRDLLSDALRGASHVPPIAAQEIQLLGYQQKTAGAGKH